MTHWYTNSKFLMVAALAGCGGTRQSADSVPDENTPDINLFVACDPSGAPGETCGARSLGDVAAAWADSVKSADGELVVCEVTDNYATTRQLMTSSPSDMSGGRGRDARWKADLRTTVDALELWDDPIDNHVTRSDVLGAIQHMSGLASNDTAYPSLVLMSDGRVHHGPLHFERPRNDAMWEMPSVTEVRFVIEQEGTPWDVSAFRGGIIWCGGGSNAGTTFAEATSRRELMVELLTVDGREPIVLPSCANAEKWLPGALAELDRGRR